jgi:CelD/BcsL family acetyltransferase involved in cellulose biosynthesis
LDASDLCEHPGVTQQYRCISLREMDDGLRRRWRELQAQAPAIFDSAYFSVEYADHVAAVRPLAELLVVEDGNQVVALMPFQRAALGRARPLGGVVSDFHGPLAQTSAVIDWPRALAAMGCGVFEFDHLVCPRPDWPIIGEQSFASPVIDLTSGYDALVAGSSYAKRTLSRARKAEREVGPMRFELHDPDPRLVDAMIGWKAAQFARTGVPNIFSVPWPRQLLERILATRSAALTGLCSALWMGDRLVAVHVGMRSAQRVHYWFPTYDADFGDYSPGIILLLYLARATAAQSAKVIDLGRGDAVYKERLMTGAETVHQGSFERPSMLAIARSTLRGAQVLAAESPTARSVLSWPTRFANRLERKRRLT